MRLLGRFMCSLLKLYAILRYMLFLKSSISSKRGWRWLSAAGTQQVDKHLIWRVRWQEQCSKTINPYVILSAKYGVWTLPARPRDPTQLLYKILDHSCYSPAWSMHRSFVPEAAMTSTSSWSRSEIYCGLARLHDDLQTLYALHQVQEFEEAAGKGKIAGIIVC